MSGREPGIRTKLRLDRIDLVGGLTLARQKYRQGDVLESFDLYEQLSEVFPDRAVGLLAELYDLYAAIPQDRYTLYQARHLEFGIQPGDKVLDIGSGHLPFPLATHLADVAVADHQYGRAGIPFKQVDGKPVFECAVESMPFADKEFDFVYCSHVLEHTRDPGKACRELMRVARRGYIETPTKGKDVFLCSAKASNHAMSVEAFDGRLIFSEYTPREIEALGCGILMEMHCSPKTDREKAFSALICLKADVVNTMRLWEGSFGYEVRRLGEPAGDDGLVREIDALLSGPGTDPEALIGLAERLTVAQHNLEAEAICNYLLGRYGKSAAVTGLLGAILCQANRLEEARVRLEEASALDPGDRAAGLNLVETLLRLGRRAEAHAECRRLHTNFPDATDIAAALAATAE